jgi:hypothetical protein
MPLYKASASELAALVAADTNTSGFIKDTEGWRILGASGVAVSHTGNTSETALSTTAVAAGAMGPNGILRVRALFSYTNSANNKNLRIRLGGVSGTEFANITATTTVHHDIIRTIHNRNSASSQVGILATSTNPLTASSGALIAGTINTANAQDLVISGQLASSGETVTLESYIVELKYGA